MMFLVSKSFEHAGPAEYLGLEVSSFAAQRRELLQQPDGCHIAKPG
jgi:hypothetical protein